MIDQLLRILKRTGRLFDAIWRDLEVIRSIDVARKGPIHKAIWIVIVIMLFIPILAELDPDEDSSSGNADEEDVDTHTDLVVMVMMYLAFVPLFLFLLSEALGSSFPWKQMFPAPISRDSIELYKRVRVFSNRVWLTGLITVYAGWILTVNFWNEVSFGEALNILYRIFLSTIVWSAIVIIFFLDITDPEKKHEQFLNTTVYAIELSFVAGMGSILILSFDSLFRGNLDAALEIRYLAMVPLWLMWKVILVLTGSVIDTGPLVFTLLYGVIGVPFILAVDRQSFRINARKGRIGIVETTDAGTIGTAKPDGEEGGEGEEWQERKECGEGRGPGTDESTAKRADGKGFDPDRESEEETREEYLKRCMEAQEEMEKGFWTMLQKEDWLSRPTSLKTIGNVLGGMLLLGLIFGSASLFCFLIISVVGIFTVQLFMLISSGVNWHVDPLVWGSKPHPCLRLLPQPPETVVSAYERQSRYGFLQMMISVSIPVAFFLILPFDIPFSPGRHPSDPTSALIVLTILPLHIASLKYVYFDWIGMEDREPSRWHGIRFYLFALLGLPYFYLLFYKFDFLGDAFASWLYHLTLSLLLVAGSTLLMRQRFGAYLRNFSFQSSGLNRIEMGNRGHHQYFLDHSEGKKADLLLAAGFLMILVFMAWPGGFEYWERGYEIVEHDFRFDEIPYDNATVYSTNTVIEGQDISFNSSVIINASFSIANSTIRFGNERPGEIGLYILPRGTLHLVNVTLTSDSYFRWEVFGNLTVHRSAITRVWGDTVHPDYEGGIEVYSDPRVSAVVFENTTISDGITNGILIGESDATFTNCSFSGFEGDAIELIRSRGRFRDTNISNAHVGIFMRDSKPVFVNTTIRDVTVWTVSKDVESDPAFRLCDFIGPEREGLERFVDPVFVDVVYFTVLGVFTVLFVWLHTNEKDK